jgi:hypothetical protein
MIDLSFLVTALGPWRTVSLVHDGWALMGFTGLPAPLWTSSLVGCIWVQFLTFSFTLILSSFLLFRTNAVMLHQKIGAPFNRSNDFFQRNLFTFYCPLLHPSNILPQFIGLSLGRQFDQHNINHTTQKLYHWSRTFEPSNYICVIIYTLYYVG